MARAVPEDTIPVCQYILVDEELIDFIMGELFRYIGNPATLGIRNRIGQRVVTCLRMAFYVDRSASDTSTQMLSESWDDIDTIWSQSSEADGSVSDETVLPVRD